MFLVVKIAFCLHIIFLFIFFLDVRSPILSSEGDAQIFRVLGEVGTQEASKSPPEGERATTS